MFTLKRTIDTQVEKYLQGDVYKTFFIWGPRRSGKTTLLEGLSKKLKVPYFDFDLQTDQELFVPRYDVLEKLASTHPIILIDEVQNYPQATVVLKLLQAKFKVKVIATGSSELRAKAGEDFDTMAGRFIEAYCLPLSLEEIVHNRAPASYARQQLINDLPKHLQVFGAYPEIHTQQTRSDQENIDLLEKIVDTYVIKDVISIYDLKNAKLARDILTKIALQIGSEVSVREIAASLGASKDTVSNYIEIFIKNYILIPLPSFKSNIRRAISENRKLYFYDLGIRNALVKDFREVDLRPDKGGLFENFIVSEVEKQRKNTNAKFSMYFYREYGGQEADLVLEDYKKNYHVLEIKMRQKGKVKDIFPLSHTFDVVDSSNYFEKIMRAVSS